MRSIIFLTTAILSCLLVTRSACAPGRLNSIDDWYSDDNRHIDTTTIPTTTEDDGYTSEYESDHGGEHESDQGSDGGSDQGGDRYSDSDSGGMEVILEKLEYHVGRLSEAEPAIKDRYTFTDGTGRSITVEYAVGLSPLPPGTIR